MHHLLYYSGTGNTKFVVEALKNITTVDTCQSVFEPLNFNEERRGTLGILFPIHSLGMPNQMVEVLNSMDFSRFDYIYCIATMGGSAGIAFKQLGEILKQKGKGLSASFSVVMGSNSNLFINIPGVNPIGKEEEKEELFEMALTKLHEISAFVESKTVVPMQKNGFFTNQIAQLAHRAFKSRLSKFDYEFRTENCHGCQTCIKHCPMDNITFQEDKVVWQHHCDACLRCFNLCPSQSIQFGNMKHPLMKIQYQNQLSLVVK